MRGIDVDDQLAIVPRRVRGYTVESDGSVMNTRAYDASNKYPAGGFTASAESYLRFLMAVGSGRVLKPDILNLTWTRQKISDGSLSAFGLGWGITKWKERMIVGFNGLQPSTTTAARYIPEVGAGVVLLRNAEVKNEQAGQEFSGLMNRLLDALDVL